MTIQHQAPEQKIEALEKALNDSQAELLRVQAELAESTVMYRTTFDMAAVGIAHTTTGGKWLRINPFFCKLLGYNLEELEGKLFQDLTHPDDLPQDLSGQEDLLNGKIGSYLTEKRYIGKNGEPLWVHLAVSLVRDEQGQPRFFISVAKEINSRILSAFEVDQSRTRLKAVLDSLSEGVIVFSNTGTVLEANPAALTLFGYADSSEISSEAQDLHASFEVWTKEGVALRPEEWPVSLMLQGQPVTNSELIIHRRGAARTWIASLSGSIVKPSEQLPPLGVLTVRDITKRHMAETALRVSEERLRLAFDNIPDMVIIYDTALRIQYANRAAALNVGKSEQELTGKRDTEVRPQSILNLWRPLLHAALVSATMQSDDFDVPSDSGLRNLAVSCVPITDLGGTVREVMVICHDYTERRQAEERVRQAALHDPLTGLPNRALLFEYARHIFSAARRSRQQVSIVFIDLDRFKPINDIHGHEAGDTVLRQVANRLRASMRGEDIVFRLGGDEFLALMPHVNGNHANNHLGHHAGNHASLHAGDKMARHLMDALSRPYQVGSLELMLSCSIGISIFPDDGEEVDTLISHADAAMYLAKQMGRNNFQFYTAALAERMHMQSMIEQGIKSALSKSEFRLCYQPLVDMRTGEVVSVEALLRWPGNGLGPDRFVQVAESTGLIERLGEWVLSEACHQHSAWKKDGLPAIPIAVNVSPLQFRKKDFTTYLEDVMLKHRIDSEAIQIELTETAVMEDIDHAIAILRHFRQKGIKISLDDFGTGYSSLNYLSRLPLDKIKVDKSFVHRLESDTASRAITEAIIAMGRTLNLEVVAEGIETASVLEYLRNQGCHQAQGYHVCKPVIGGEFAAWYRTRSLPDGAGMH
ncbi:sensor domain-containing protein [Noviherbaspirillum malthae]|uniref:sensor domain-containing protein n=1 Tax=Noviherbaspirillum malthae TaxID=1260987 RepID=UPI0018906D20|nr:EAL domain-containing protein [Noviherbaspirillum malthae]